MEAATPARRERPPAAATSPRRPTPANGPGPISWPKRCGVAHSFLLFTHDRRSRRRSLLRLQQDPQAAAQSPQPACDEHAHAQQEPAEPQPQLVKIRGAVGLDLL